MEPEVSEERPGLVSKEQLEWELWMVEPEPVGMKISEEQRFFAKERSSEGPLG